MLGKTFLTLENTPIKRGKNQPKNPILLHFLHEAINFGNIGSAEEFCPRHFGAPKDFAIVKMPQTAQVSVISSLVSLTYFRTVRGEQKKTLARMRDKGTRLLVFSGKQVGLNRVILLILNSQKLLAKYDMFLEIKNMKGLRHIDSKTVYRRMGALEREGWITQKGNRPAKSGWPSEL